MLKPEVIASFFREKSSQVTVIFNILSEKGLLHKENYIECPICYTLIHINDYKKAVNDQESFECTHCQRDLSNQALNEVEIYRLNPEKIHIAKDKTETISGIPSSVLKGFHEELPQKLLKDPFRNTPLLRYYSRDPELVKLKPFEGKRVFFVLHFLRDLVPFVKACENLGLNLKNSYFFYKDYPYPQRDAIKQWLEEESAIVKPRSYIHQYLKQVAESPMEHIGKILIVEDGGFFVPLIHSDFTQLIPNTIGAVEQTTRGIRNAEEIKELKFPIISVATSKLKSQFEPQYIAKAVIDNIRRMLPHVALNGKSAALFGYGTIGKEIAKWLDQNKVKVTVFDPSHENTLQAHQEGFNVEDSPIYAAQNKNFVIGASGNESITSEVIANLSHGTYLVSASSELYEIDMEELQRQQITAQEITDDSNENIGTDFMLPPNNRIVHVLANGYPINFWGFDSMPEEASDLILSLILLCSAELALGDYSTCGINSNAVNELAEKYEIAKKFLEFHKG